MALTEQEYNELYKHALNQAHKYIGYSDIAYDIAQNAILAFLSSKTPIEKPKPWLNTIVRREVKKNRDERGKVEKISTRNLINNQSEAKQNDHDTFDFNSINPQKVKQYLNTNEYKYYMMLKKHAFLTSKCSEKEKIPYETVKSNLRRLKMSLLAGYLFENGWKHGVKILNFSQYNSIYRGINKLIDCVKSKKMAELRTYFKKVDNEQIQRFFEDVEACIEWHVISERDYYRLYLVCTPFNPAPKFLEILFKFNKANFLYILDIVEKKPYMVSKGSIDKVNRYKDKGKITLSENQIVSILSDQQTDIYK